jgi:hypothetical protein
MCPQHHHNHHLAPERTQHNTLAFAQLDLCQTSNLKYNKVKEIIVQAIKFAIICYARNENQYTMKQDKECPKLSLKKKTNSIWIEIH